MSVILITGGTGLIGTTLTRHLTGKGYRVIILTRNPGKKTKQGVDYAQWDPALQTIDEEAIATADHIIHLAGANVMEKRWTKKFRKEIVESRTKSGELLVKSLNEIPNHVRTVVSASAIGWYPATSSQETTDNFKEMKETDPPGNDFLSETCMLWEKSIQPVEQAGKKLIILRTGIVLSDDGGALKEFETALKFGIATILGNGKQIMSWIHIDDLCRLYIDGIENPEMNGVYNAVTPVTATNKELVLKLAAIKRKKFYLPVHVPRFVLKIMLGERAEEILKSIRVSCEKIKGTGFTFLYPSIDDALNALA